MQMIHYGQDILRNPAEDIHEFDDELIKTADDMYTTMHLEQGVGLAAPQVGIGKRLVVIQMEDGNRLDLINPKIISHGSRMKMDSEGWLSIPRLIAKVPRYQSIEVDAKNIYGETLRFMAQNFFARVIQHEVDHINGILYIDRISPKELLKLKPYLIKLNPNCESDLMKTATRIKKYNL